MRFYEPCAARAARRICWIFRCQRINSQKSIRTYEEEFSRRTQQIYLLFFSRFIRTRRLYSDEHRCQQGPSLWIIISISLRMLILCSRFPTDQFSSSNISSKSQTALSLTVISGKCHLFAPFYNLVIHKIRLLGMYKKPAKVLIDGK